jgi:hypothetical protein
MKSVLLLITGILLFITTNLLAQPRIQAIPGTTLELGDYIQGQKAEKIVHIRNSGTDTLRIGEVRAACGCTATLMTKKNLAPGDTGDLSITFNTEHYTGRATKQVFVQSNDSTSPKLTITFSASITPVLSVSPQYFAFEKATLDTTMIRTVNITNGLPKDHVKITSVHTESDMIKLTLMKNELMPAEQTQLQAVFHPTKTGSLQGDIEVTTDNPNLPTMKIHYYSWVTKQP